MNLPKLVLFGLGIANLIVVNTALAMPRLSRETEAVVQQVDHEARAMSLKLPKDAKSVEFVWNHHTRFVENGQTVESTELKPGTDVKIRYRSPWVGKKLVKYISWKTR